MLKSCRSCCRPPVREVRISDWREAGPEAEEGALMVKLVKLDVLLQLDVMLQAAMRG